MKVSGFGRGLPGSRASLALSSPRFGGEVEAVCAEEAEFEFGDPFDDGLGVGDFFVAKAGDLDVETVGALGGDDDVFTAGGVQAGFDDGLSGGEDVWGDGAFAGGLDADEEGSAALEVDAFFDAFAFGDAEDAEGGEDEREDGADDAFPAIGFGGEVGDEETGGDDPDAEDEVGQVFFHLRQVFSGSEHESGS